FWRSTSRTLGSPSAATACRATFLARSQFTGPPCHDIRSANCRNASANCCGSPSGPNGLAPPVSSGGPPDDPDAEPEEPEPEEPEPGRPPPGGPKPKGRSGIVGASQAGWKDHISHVISGAAHLEHRTGPGSPGADCSGRGRHRGRARARACADGPPRRLGAGEQGHRDRRAARRRRRGDLALGRRARLATRLAGVDVLVHTDVDTSVETDYRARRAANVRAAQTVLTAAAAGRVGRVILITSAMVYGARPDNPVPLAESAPLRADPDGSV